jgi:hypothetical protein
VNANVSDFHSILQLSFQSFYGEALSMLIQAIQALHWLLWYDLVMKMLAQRVFGAL